MYSFVVSVADAEGNAVSSSATQCAPRFDWRFPESRPDVYFRLEALFDNEAVTHSATGKWVELFQGPLSDEHYYDDFEVPPTELDVDVTHLIPLKRGDHVDSFIGDRYDAGSLTMC